MEGDSRVEGGSVEGGSVEGREEGVREKEDFVERKMKAIEDSEAR